MCTREDPGNSLDSLLHSQKGLLGVACFVLTQTFGVCMWCRLGVPGPHLAFMFVSVGNVANHGQSGCLGLWFQGWRTVHGFAHCCISFSSLSCWPSLCYPKPTINKRKELGGLHFRFSQLGAKQMFASEQPPYTEIALCLPLLVGLETAGDGQAICWCSNTCQALVYRGPMMCWQNE